MTDQPVRRTNEDIEALKKSWMADPCWDIETTEGFEFHKDALYTFRERQENEWSAEQAEREESHFSLIREQTGVTDFDVAVALSTWAQIENSLERLAKLETSFEVDATINLTRATLLQAAQLKRIADALEDIAGGDALVAIKG